MSMDYQAQGFGVLANSSGTYAYYMVGSSTWVAEEIHGYNNQPHLYHRYHMNVN
ncbi:hypothetical protein YC2023_085136 [Brassica napus]